MQARRSPPRRRCLAWLIVALAGWGLFTAGGAHAQQASLLVTTVEGVITPVVAAHLDDAVAAAAGGGHSALLVELDTPGGLDTSMRAIVQEFLTAPVPVIVYVSPPGARAASAGAIITLAAHVAAMAPGTNIGAATPIDLEGGEVIDKIVNDAAAYVEAVAEARGRDVEFAVATVREGRSIAASEAVEVGAVDLVAADRAALLAELDGRSVTLAPGGEEVVLRTGGATIVEYELSLTRRLLQALADPNLAFLLLSIGTLGVIYELASPGAGLGGILGAIMLILAFFSLAVLPVNLAGVLLLLLAVALFVAELFVPGVGVFAGGGTIALVLAGLFLFQRPTGVGLDLSFLIPVGIVAGLVAVVIGRIAWRSRFAPEYSGTGSSMVGERATVRTADGDEAQVLAGGALWKARSVSGPLEPGEQVSVVGRDGLVLLVDADGEDET